MSIRNFRYWEPLLDLRVTSGFPAQLLPTFNDRIMSFETEDDHRKMDTATLTLDNSDGALLDIESMSLGIDMRVAYGYVGAMSIPRTLTCRKINGAMRVGGLGVHFQGPHTAAGGAVALQLRSKIWKFNRFRALGNEEGDPDRVLIFRNTTIPGIVRVLAERNGFTPNQIIIDELEDETLFSTMTIPAILSDAEWIADQAKHRDWTFSVDADGFHFHKPGLDRIKDLQTEELIWFGGDPDVIEWEIEGDLNISQLIKAGSTNKERGFAKVKGPNLRSDKSETAGSTESAVIVELKRGGKLLGRDSVASIARGKDFMSEKLERAVNRALNRWTMKLRLVGNPNIRARQGMDLLNFGPLIDGRWWIRKAKHSIRPGQVYITEVEAKRRSPQYGAGRKDRAAAKAAGAQGTESVVIVEFARPGGAVLIPGL